MSEVGVPRVPGVLIKRHEFDAPPASFVKFELFDLYCENRFAEFELNFK